MALATTTLSAACAQGDKEIQVASATSVAAGRLVLVDQEVMQVVSSYVSGLTVGVIRGQDGTAQVAHASGASVTHGLGSDFASPAAGTVASYAPAAKAVPKTSYSAAGAIALPVAGTFLTIAELNGTGALAMTLANPTRDLDGCLLYVGGNGKAAHTITYTAGLGNGGAGLDVMTFDTNALCGVAFIALGGFWLPFPSPLSGTLTGVDVAVA